jgi:hypothetical protein
MTLEQSPPQRRLGLTVVVALALVGAGGLASVHFESTRATTPLPVRAVIRAQQAARTDAASQMSCLDLPVSSAVLDPRSCWLTGPTSALLVGSVPGNSSEGAIVIVQGQGRNLTALPSSGALQVTEVNGTSACVMGAQGQFRSVDLIGATVSSSWTSRCALATGTGPAPTPIVTAPRTSNSRPVSSSQAQSLSDLPPSVTPSYYEYYSYYSECTSSPTPSCPFYQQGESTAAPPQNGLLVLDFGSPCYVPGTSVYGVEMFFQPTCIRDTSLQPLVENWISGYESQNVNTTVNLTLAIGTSNSYNGVDSNYALTDAEMSASGQSWYQNLVGAISTAGLSSPLTIWGANDMEQSSDNDWSSGTPTVDWVEGYDTASPAAAACDLDQPGYLANYGDDVLGGSGSEDSWTVAQVYEVSWGLPAACAEPEIYYSDMATEWQELNAWTVDNLVPTIQFSGVMTEVESGTLGPDDAWSDLESDTGQSPPIPSVTTIAWTLQNLPQVSSVSPAQGPIAGGTTVLISGSYLAGAEAVDFGDVAAASYTVNSANSISATSPPGSAGYVDVTVQTAAGTSSPVGGDGFVYTTPGAYHPLVPTRIEDTRPGSGLAGSGQAPGPGDQLGVQVAGQGGVPSSGVAAIVVNLTVTDPTASGYVGVFPTGVARPLASTIDFLAGQTKANMAEVALGLGGQISVYNAAGTTQVVVDVEGWYDTSAPTSGAGLYNSLPPQRIVDTRPGTGTPYSGQMLGPGQALTVEVAGAGGVPSSGAEAVVLNVTAVDATAASVVSVFPAGIATPLASTVNFAAGEIVPNQDTVELGTDGDVTIFNYGPGSTDVILDVAGWYSNGTAGASSGSSFNVLIPTRVVDTRAGSGQPYAGDTLAPSGTLIVDLSGMAGIPSQNVTGVLLNATVTNTGSVGYLAVWPDGQPVPPTSELNWSGGQTTENGVMIGLGTDGALDFYNQSPGSTDLVVDVSGWFGEA